MMYMSRVNSIVCMSVVLTLIVSVSTDGLGDHNERCTISEGAGVTVDSCDGSKHLSCRNEHCECTDMVNQVWSFRFESEKRHRRGIGKKVAIGAGGAFVGYEVAKATSGGHSSSSSSQGSSSSKKKKIESCYGRVGAPCALNYNNVVTNSNSSSTTTTTTTTTTHDGLTTPNHEDINATSTTTTSAPMVIDLHKLAGCVQYAVCKPQNAGGDNTTHIRFMSSDPRVGMCMCDSGYSKTSADMCEKSSQESLMSSMSLITLLFTCITILY